MNAEPQSEGTMHTMPAIPGEPLVDYLLRVLQRARETGKPVSCEHLDHAFVADHTMTTTDVVRAWHEAAAHAAGHGSRGASRG